MSTSGQGRGLGVPTTSEQQAKLINHYVNKAIGSLGHGRGRFDPNGTPIGQASETHGCSCKTFLACHPRTFSGTEGPLDKKDGIGHGN
jgi:hypothetical protein